MTSTPTRILAIDPGTRHMGIAVLERNDLIYHGVTSFKRVSSPHEFLTDAQRVIGTLLSDLKPQLLVVEKAFFAKSRRTALLSVFVNEIYPMARRQTIKVLGLAPSTVKKRITGDGHADKTMVAQAVIAVYPHLRVFLTQDRKWKARYHSNMFDAVALAIVARRMLPADEA